MISSTSEEDQEVLNSIVQLEIVPKPVTVLTKWQQRRKAVKCQIALARLDCPLISAHVCAIFFFDTLLRAPKKYHCASLDLFIIALVFLPKQIR